MWYLPLRAFLLVLGLTGTGAVAQTADCGGQTACEIETGAYYVALPEQVQNAPVVLWLHGSNGRAERAVRPNGLARNFLERGYVFVAAQGVGPPERPDHRDWNVRDGYEEPRDDVAFLASVLDDVAARFGTDPDRVLLAGFSRGASMAWDFACARPERISGLAVAAGGFWEPMPEACAGPVNLFHSHGFKDRTVPLEGRKISWGGRKFWQGSIFKGLDIWREANGCTGAADANSVQGTVWEKRWTNCKAGSIRLQITPIGHGIPKGWSKDVLDWFGEITATQG